MSVREWLTAVLAKARRMMLADAEPATKATSPHGGVRMDRRRHRPTTGATPVGRSSAKGRARRSGRRRG